MRNYGIPNKYISHVSVIKKTYLGMTCRIYFPEATCQKSSMYRREFSEGVFCLFFRFFLPLTQWWKRKRWGSEIYSISWTIWTLQMIWLYCHTNMNRCRRKQLPFKQQLWRLASRSTQIRSRWWGSTLTEQSLSFSETMR